MLQPDIDEDGRMLSPPLRQFSHYIEEGMSCNLKLVIEREGTGAQSVQFSMTADQCRELAQILVTCAMVIELERPTSPQ
jgi:hypothetical protein